MCSREADSYFGIDLFAVFSVFSAQLSPFFNTVIQNCFCFGHFPLLPVDESTFDTWLFDSHSNYSMYHGRFSQKTIRNTTFALCLHHFGGQMVVTAVYF